MILQLKYTAQLRTVLKRPEESIELPDGGSLEDLLKRLSVQNPGAKSHLLNATGQVNPCLLLVVNNACVAAADVPSLRLKDGDVVMLLPPIAGG